MAGNRECCKHLGSSERRFVEDPLVCDLVTAPLHQRNESHRKFRIRPSSPLSQLSLGDSLWSHSHSCRATPSTPAFIDQSSARTWPWTHKARAEREETHHGYQKERQSWTIGLFLTHLMRLNRHKHNFCRTLAKLWQRIWSGHAVMSKSFIKCALNYKLLAFEYRHWEATNKWQMQCEGPLE